MPWGETSGYLGQGASPLPPSAASQQYQPFYGTEGFPSFGGGVMGTMAQIAMGMGAQGIMASLNMTPMGLTDRNMYDRFQQKRLTGAHDEMLRGLAGQDQKSMMATVQGLANLSGEQWGTEQQKTASAATGALSAAMPMASMIAPDFVDSLMGKRGSAVGMGQGMFRGNQMRADSVTGQDMLAGGGKKSGQIASSVFNELYGGSRYKDREGMGATSMGQMYAELQSRGMMSAPVTVSELAETQHGSDAIRKGLAQQGLKAGSSPAELQNALRGLDPKQMESLSNNTEVAAELDKFDSKKIANTLKKYQGAVVAMKDIFGEAGRPDAPMGELIEALNKMSGGTVSQVDPATVEHMVRTTANLAKSAGVGPEGALMAVNESSQMAQAMGVNKAFAGQAAQQGLAMQGAYQREGLGAVQAWGLGNIDEIRRGSEQMNLRAANSTAAMQVGTALRMQTEMWLNEKTMFNKGPEGDKAKEYFEQMKQGHIQNLSSSEFTGMMVSGVKGMSEDRVARMLTQTEGNQEAVFKAGATKDIQRAQRDEFMAYAKEATAFTANGAIYGAMMPDEKTLQKMAPADRQKLDAQRIEMTKGISGAAVDALGNMKASQRSDPRRRTEIMARAIEEQMAGKLNAETGKVEGGSDAGRKILSGMSREEKNVFLQSQASDIYREMEQDEVIQGNFGSLQNYLTQNDKGAQKRMQQLTTKAGIDARVQKAMGGLGKGGLVRRAIDAIQTAQPGDDIRQVLGKAVGGIEGRDLADALVDAKTKDGEPLYQQIQADRKKIQDLQQQAAAAPPGAAREKIMDQLTGVISGMEGHVTEMRQSLKDAGIKVESPIKKKELEKAIKDQNWVSKQAALGAEGKADLSYMATEDRKKLDTAIGGSGGILSRFRSRLTAEEAMGLNEEEFNKSVEGGDMNAEQKKTVRAARKEHNERLRTGYAKGDQGMADLSAKVLGDNETMMAVGEDGRKVIQDMSSARSERAKAVAEAGGADAYMRKLGTDKDLKAKDEALTKRLDAGATFLKNVEEGKGPRWGWAGDKDERSFLRKIAKEHGTTFQEMATGDVDEEDVAGWTDANGKPLAKEDKERLHKFFGAQKKETEANEALRTAQAQQGSDLVRKLMGKGKDTDKDEFADMVEESPALARIVSLAQGQGSASVEAQAKLEAFSAAHKDDKGEIDIDDRVQELSKTLGLDKDSVASDHGDSAAARTVTFKVLHMEMKRDGSAEGSGESVQEPAQNTGKGSQ